MATLAEYDLEYGAELLCYLKRHCSSCGVLSTPLWRKGWFDTNIGRYVSLCNACGLKYSKNQYCPICKYVYNIREDVFSHRHKWIICTSCDRYTHVDCVQDNVNVVDYVCIECQL